MAMAYFISFSTYGTWLHGTDKGEGSVDRAHRAYRSPFVECDAARENAARARMLEPPYVLGPKERDVVRDAIVGLCDEKGWSLSALHVRTNHVHVIVSADREPGRLMSDLKARASRELNHSAGDPRDKRWTRHGSTRHLFDEASVSDAIEYVLDEQGPPMATFDPRGKPRDEPPKEPRTK